MSVDILYSVFNRKEFVEESLKHLLKNTNWNLVNRMVIYDDMSSDGTEQIVNLFSRQFCPRPCIVIRKCTHSPIVVMNDFLKFCNPSAELFVKIDSDVMLPPLWLNQAYRVMQKYPTLGLLGLEALAKDSAPSEELKKSFAIDYSFEVTDSIGGVGLMRRSIFKGESIPLHKTSKYGGFGEWQHQHREVVKGWITPQIKMFLLDRLPMEPWKSLSQKYNDLGWQRPWTNYTDSNSYLWDWWESIPYVKGSTA